MNTMSQCPFHDGKVSRTALVRALDNQMWWPNKLNLAILNKNSPLIDPFGGAFDYAEAFRTLDLEALKADIRALMTDSQDWWPADFGHYGPFFVRMAWHSAGTYRIGDGRGGAGSGQQRFAPLDSWPDNVNLDKARRLLWPIKRKYGAAISWADLIVLTGTVAIEAMGLPMVGFGGGRVDSWEPEADIYWGPEAEWLGDERYTGDRELEDPLAAVQIGLIYVNPEGPNGNPDPAASARDIRETFARMAMNDYETVALIAGGHAFGKCHGAGDTAHVGAEPQGAPIEQLGLGWKSTFGTGKGADSIGSGLEVTWSQTPTQWSNHYLDNLFGFEWELGKSPAGAHQWFPANGGGAGTVPDAHRPDVTHQPTMLTSDLALRFDPVYEPIARHFHANPDELGRAFAEAWYKLTHRDLGPVSRYLGADVPAEPRIWQDPVPAAIHPLIDEADVGALKARVLVAGLPLSRLVKTAWASASTFRHTDKRGGANGARVRLAPQKDWAVNEPAALAEALTVLGGIRDAFNAESQRHVTLADLIVLAGNAAVEAAAAAAGHEVVVPFHPGRTDADDAMTDHAAFAVLEPRSDGFRNYSDGSSARSPEDLLVERANLLGLTAPEMTALVGGLRVLGGNLPDDTRGVFTARREVLSNDFFVNLLDSATTCTWTEQDGAYVARTAGSDAVVYRASRVDLVFAADAQLRAISEVYAAGDGEARFIAAFVAAWTKVMEADRFDLR